uniref:Helitron_like_N domain-containing protein n=1 Tax=Panagrellus redivivus TaxID=6233 RepID=A0A7E4VX61_PANRE
DDTEEKIVDFINRHITARLPDPAKEPLLHGLVDRLQRHNKNCTNTCKRFVKYQGRVSQRCRFEFPRKASRRTVINKNREVLLGVRTATTKYYTLRRRKDRDEHINDYNPAILLAWRGNIDLQFISPDSIDIINYVTGYATKNESGKKDSLLQECLNDEMDKSALFQTLLGFMKQRETGVMEIVDWLNG